MFRNLIKSFRKPLKPIDFWVWVYYNISRKLKMGFSTSAVKEMKIIKARVWHENCKRCGKPILPGQYYIGVDGSLTSIWDCWRNRK